MEANTEAKGGHTGWGTYYLVFNALILLTLTTVAISYVNFVNHAGNIIAAMAVAIMKASLVVYFFMHMKSESRLNRYAAMFPVVLFFVALLAISADFIFLGTYSQSAQVGHSLMLGH